MSERVLGIDHPNTITEYVSSLVVIPFLRQRNHIVSLSHPDFYSRLTMLPVKCDGLSHT
jgi:hypothetical protein